MRLARVQEKRPPQPALAVTNDDYKDADWKEIYEKVKRKDDAMIKDYDSEIDTLLVFAGLFSAVLTAFIVDVYQNLNVNYAQDSAAALRRILAHLEGQTVLARVPAPSATPSATVIIVIVLWFVSLVLSLLSALFSIFIKQWLHTYEKWTEVAHSNLQQGLILRGFYRASFNSWRVGAIFAALSVLLQIALVLFVIGLVAYLWTLNFVVSGVLSFFALLMFVLSALVIALPIFYEDCPYKFPLLIFVLPKFRTNSAERDWTERDMPIAKRHLRLDEKQPPLAHAIARTALLLDITPNQLDLAICSEDNITSATQTDLKALAETVTRDRVRELSPESTALLASIVTHDTMLRSALGEDDHIRLLGLWQLTFGPMARAPLTIFRAMHYLEKRIMQEESSDLRWKYVELLVTCILPQCRNLSGTKQVSDGPLAAELSRAALVVHDWAKASNDSAHATQVALRALKLAATCIPFEKETTGLSPVTPYLSLLDALGDAIDEIIHLGKPLYAPAMLELEQADQLYSDLRNHHAAFLCTQARGYKSSSTDEPRRVCFSSDSARIFIGTDERAAWVLNPATGDSDANLTAPLPSGITFHYANFTRDGERAFWGSREGPLFLVKSTSREPIQLEGIGYGRASRVEAVSHDGTQVLVASEAESAALCDANTGETLMTFEGHSKRICRAAFASVLPPARDEGTQAIYTTDADEDEPPMEPERPRLATSSYDNTVRIWDVDTGSCVAIFDNLGVSVNGVCWSSDATKLAITSAEIIRVFEVATRVLECQLEGHTKLVPNVTFSPNDQLLASASNDHTVRVWNLAKKTCVAILTGPEDDVSHVEFSPDGRSIAAAADSGVWIWDVNPLSIYRTTDPPKERPTLRHVVRRVMLLQSPGFGKKEKNKIENVVHEK